MTVIREVTPADSAAVCSLMAELAVDLRAEQPATPEFVHRHLSLESTGGFIAEQDRVIGAVLYSVWPMLWYGTNHGTIEILTVATGCRGTGIGATLLAMAEADLGARGCSAYSLATPGWNRRAITFYQRLGYTNELVLLEKTRARGISTAE